MKKLMPVLLVVAATAACSSRRGEPLTGALPIEDPAIESGRTVFMQNCYRCHPGGEAGIGPSLNDKAGLKFVKKLKIRHSALGPMPSFSKKQLGDQQLDDLMAYLAALRRYDQSREGVVEEGSR